MLLCCGSFLLEDTDGSSYLSAVSCLHQTQGLIVDGTPFTAWFTLIPPAEGALGSCSTPADSPLTHVSLLLLTYSSPTAHLILT